MADFEYSSDLDLSAIKKRLAQSAKDFEGYQKIVERKLAEIEKSAVKTAEREAKAAERANERKAKAAEKAVAQQIKAAQRLAAKQAQIERAAASVGRLGGGKIGLKRLDQDAIELKQSLATLRKSGEFEITKLGDGAKRAGFSFDGLKSKVFALAGAVGTITGLAAAVGFLVNKAAELQKSQFSLAASVQAANNEFGDSAGSLEGWKETIEEVRQETKLFSERELAGAVSRLIDMTKRLGLGRAEQEEILKRSLDVGAGKFSPEESIERVSAALRGEAEAAEALGLTLSETAVREYAEQQGLVWKELDETAKAQARYKLFLEQTEPVVGRAAALSKTLAGAEQARQAQMEDNLATIGSQLIPIYEAWALGISLVAQESADGSGVITRALAAIYAAAITAGAGIITFRDSAVSMLSTVQAGFEAVKSGRNPFTAMSEEIDRTRPQAAAFGNFLKDIPGVFDEARRQLIDGWTEQRQAAEDAAATVGGLPPVYGDVGEAADEAAVSLEDYEKAVEAVNKANEDFSTQKIRDELDAQIKAERAATDAMLDNARAREDLAKKNLEAIQKIEAGHQQRLDDSARDAGRAEEDAARDTQRNLADISRDQAQKAIDIARQAAQKRVDIETAYRRRLQDIARQFSLAAVDAERERDAVAFLQARRERDAAVAEAGTERGRAIEDLGTETGRQQEEARLEAQRAREEARLQAEQAAEDRAVENERKMEDLRQQLERELQAQAEANERELEQQRVKEEQAAADRATAQEREAADRELANQRKLEDLEKSLAEEVALKEKYEAQLTAAAKKGSEQRLEIARKEAAEMRRLQQQSASGAGRGGNPLTGGPSRGFPGRAAGGPVVPGITYTVGERGPEPFSPNVPGHIYPSRTPSAVPAPAGASFSRVDNSLTNINNLDLLDPTRFTAAQMKILENRVAQMMAEAAARNRRAGVR